MDCNERIRALREDRDLTRTFVAEMLHVGQKTYSDYELGRTRIPLDSVIILAKHYNVSLDYICGVSRPCLKIGGMPNGERFFLQSRQIFAGGLTPGKKI